MEDIRVAIAGLGAIGRSLAVALNAGMPGLRLACAVQHCSAQALVTEALDRLLDGYPEVEALIGRLPAIQKR